MNLISDKINKAQNLFLDRLKWMGENGGLTRERYIRFLQMQYHLTNGVQRHFLLLAAHPETSKKRELRKWLVQFAYEEEHHYLIAKNDLKELSAAVGEPPLDTLLWWLFFDKIIPEKPFVRLGATCILENIGGSSSDFLDLVISKSDFMTPKNTRFMQIHRHGPNLDHGNQVVEALMSADLLDSQWEDVYYGADIATIFYLRLTDWVINGSN